MRNFSLSLHRLELMGRASRRKRERPQRVRVPAEWFTPIPTPLERKANMLAYLDAWAAEKA